MRAAAGLEERMMRVNRPLSRTNGCLWLTHLVDFIRPCIGIFSRTRKSRDIGAYICEQTRPVLPEKLFHDLGLDKHARRH